MFECFGGYGNYGGGFLGSLMGLAMIVLAVVIIVYIIRRMRFDGNSEVRSSIDTTEEALSILNVKFASGEISEEEYEKRKNLILKK